MRHLSSSIAKSFSEALRFDTEAGSWIFVSAQVGVAIPPNNKPISFEQEARVTFDRIREALRKLDADMDKIVSTKVYLTDLAPYAEFSKVRGEVFPHNPPTSSAVKVFAGLLLGARIEIDAVAFFAQNDAAMRTFHSKVKEQESQQLGVYLYINTSALARSGFAHPSSSGLLRHVG